jgi:hypothetical protein
MIAVTQPTLTTFVDDEDAIDRCALSRLVGPGILERAAVFAIAPHPGGNVQ